MWPPAPFPWKRRSSSCARCRTKRWRGRQPGTTAGCGNGARWGPRDSRVGEEAAGTAEFLGNRVDRLFDVGVAGIHRLLLQEERLRGARVIVVAAGMEGALASVVGGL